MDALLDAIGLTSGDLTQILVIIAILLVGLFVVRGMFRLTATLFRLGCLVVIIIAVLMLWLKLFN
ncbi:MAG: hypothetical protein R3C62_03500 [Chloroflexota bacterium]